MKRLFPILLAACLLSSCSIGFRREWQQALKNGPQPGAVGAWQGTWHSEATGHHGRLRCVVHPGTSEGDHVFHYHATWAGILSGAFRATHRVQKKPTSWTFEGHHDMPNWAGGRYQYLGTIQEDAFDARYTSAKDRGTFQMTRVK